MAYSWITFKDAVMRTFYLLIIILFIFPLKSVGSDISDSSRVLSVPDSLQRIMTEEADDLIDYFPEGRQDQLADAILHSLKDQSAELISARKSFSNIEYKNSDVKEEIITPMSENFLSEMCLYKKSDNEKENVPLMIYLNGGGWAFSSNKNGRNFCAKIASLGDINVISVDYPTTPETGLDDILLSVKKSLKYIFSDAESLKIKSDNIFIAGEDSGGWAILELLKEKEELNYYLSKGLKGIVLYSPISLYSDYKEFPSWKKYSRGYGLDRRLFEIMLMAADYSNYLLKNSKNGVNFIDCNEFENWPPILMIESGRDILIDNNIRLYNDLRDCGIDISQYIFNGAIHYFISCDGQPSAMSLATKLTINFIDNLNTSE